ncbi:MAG: hypothetical protein JW925_10675 [Syntrophaceae bacterium]|nr:hypothetical protein [Syntrophaceae bacterium]
MTLQNWANNGWLRAHKTSKQEIRQLLEIVERDLKDAQQKGLSSDWRFGIAYNAALKLCTILVYSEGYRPEKTLAHYRTLQAIPLILGPKKEDDAEYLDSCRAKRNIVEYDYIGGATNADADELIAFVIELKKEVSDWLKTRHPEYFGK